MTVNGQKQLGLDMCDLSDDCGETYKGMATAHFINQILTVRMNMLNLIGRIEYRAFR